MTSHSKMSLVWNMNYVCQIMDKGKNLVKTVATWTEKNSAVGEILVWYSDWLFSVQVSG